MPQNIEDLPYRPCVGVMLLDASGRVFAGQRLDRDAEAWQMPQGGIDPGEEPREAALRELEEETGIRRDLVSVEAETPDWIAYDLPPELVPRVWGGRYRGQQQRWFLMRFHGRDEDVRIDTAHPEFSEWRWLPPEELIDRIVPFKRHVYAQVLKAFRAAL
jgi:putative (di)nucleoside polyphosphate hydrolase